MYDHYLLNVVRVLDNQETLQNDKTTFLMGCTKDVFDTFRNDTIVGPWLTATYPHTLGLIDAYFEDSEEDRNPYENPFRATPSQIIPVRVLLIDEVGGNIRCTLPDWTGKASREVLIRNPESWFPVGPAGTLYDFMNPATTYVVPLFLGTKAPTYTYELSKLIAEATVEVLETDEALAWSKVLSAASVEKSKQ